MLLLVVGLSGFHAPLGSGTRRRHGPLLSAADEYEIRPAKGIEEQMAEAAEFFVDGFWLAGTTTGAVELSGSERAQLTKLSTDDMMGRYGELVGQRRLRSKLYVARDSAGALVGCVGVEAAMIDMVDRRVLTRAQGEALFAQEFAAMGDAANPNPHPHPHPRPHPRPHPHPSPNLTDVQASLGGARGEGLWRKGGAPWGDPDLFVSKARRPYVP